VPDRRRHRGPHPRDTDQFSAAQLPELRRAAGDLAWLLSRAYPVKAAVKLVGDRYALRVRQRSAIQRATVGDALREARQARRVGPDAVAGEPLLVDGYNVLLTVESALGGGIVLACRDGAYRDMASMAGHYKRVEQTRSALRLLGAFLAAAGCSEVRWYLDRPISNSGRLRALMEDVAAEHAWPWVVELVASPDRELAASDELVASADGWILDQGGGWLNLAREVVDRDVREAWVVDLFPSDLSDLSGRPLDLDRPLL